MVSVPPLESICNKFLQVNDTNKLPAEESSNTSFCKDCELPLIDVVHLYHKDDCRNVECKRRIADAAKVWGFFQIINHGIPRDVLIRMQSEQRKLFEKPFEEKIISSSSGSCYRWGNPTAMSLQEFSWSEAFHLPLCHVPSLSSSGLNEFTEQVSNIAQRISEILAESLGCKSTLFAEICSQNSSYVRLNRYPPCPNFPKAYGLIPHTDSDFLTVLYQDQLGGLQLLKDGEWINVNPNQDVLIINVGDLFEAWSNGFYKSIKHRVVTNPVAERQSIAYFLCPTHETVIQSYCSPSLYRKFSFGEYRKQIQEDVKSTGTKIGLPKFLK
ncbi:gibberellin 2-beta-dioxygenase 8-like [Apium graveolens]|uniref:gibberellin 2-beta-dioxygenase 8-like n=1 Tax=Apium graveolens TaxID=4045 RepID=UPI003D78DCBF